MDNVFNNIISPCNIRRYGDNNTWIVKFWGDYIETVVTASASDVDNWIGNTISIHRYRLRKLVVGLDTEWCNDDRQTVAIIQVCVGHRCLVFQLLHRDIMPQSLVNFLGNKDFTFVGKEVRNDAWKLFEDYGLIVAKVEDVSRMAASKYNDKDFKKMGLATLVTNFLRVWMEKPKEITMSEWDREELDDKQIQYAAIDAFVSFKLAIELKKPRFNTSVLC